MIHVTTAVVEHVVGFLVAFVPTVAASAATRWAGTFHRWVARLATPANALESSAAVDAIEAGEAVADYRAIPSVCHV